MRNWYVRPVKILALRTLDTLCVIWNPALILLKEVHFLSWSFKFAVKQSFHGCVMFNPRHWSGSQIRISIRITPNFELVLAMVVASVLNKFHQNPTSSFWEILLTNKQTNKPTNKPTNKQTNKQTNTRRWLQFPAFRGKMMTCLKHKNRKSKKYIWKLKKS